MLDSVESGVLVPLLSRLVRANEEFGFIYIFQSTDFDAALTFLAFHQECEID